MKKELEEFSDLIDQQFNMPDPEIALTSNSLFGAFCGGMLLLFRRLKPKTKSKIIQSGNRNGR